MFVGYVVKPMILKNSLNKNPDVVIIAKTRGNLDSEINHCCTGPMVKIFQLGEEVLTYLKELTSPW